MGEGEGEGEGEEVTIEEWGIVMTVGLSSEWWLWFLLIPLILELKMRPSPGTGPGADPSAIPTSNGPPPVKNDGLFVLATFAIVYWLPPAAAAALMRRDSS